MIPSQTAAKNGAAKSHTALIALQSAAKYGFAKSHAALASSQPALRASPIERPICCISGSTVPLKKSATTSATALIFSHAAIAAGAKVPVINSEILPAASVLTCFIVSHDELKKLVIVSHASLTGPGALLQSSSQLVPNQPRKTSATPLSVSSTVEK